MNESERDPHYAFIEQFLRKYCVLEPPTGYSAWPVTMTFALLQDNTAVDSSIREPTRSFENLSPPQSYQMKIDSTLSTMKVMIYHNAVDEKYGTFRYVPGNTQAKTTPFEKTIRKASDTTGFDSTLRNRPEVSCTLPIYLCRKATFGNEFFDGTPGSERLSARKKKGNAAHRCRGRSSQPALAGTNLDATRPPSTHPNLTARRISLMPIASFGLPVYNGERYLADTIGSILAQTHTDFELIISDNASTDATPDILAEYVGRDTRIRVVRQTQGIGAAANFAEVLSLAKGRYFAWAGDHDLYDPRWLEEMVDALDGHASAVLVYPWYRGISLEGDELYRFTTSFETTGMDSRQRIDAVTRRMRGGGSRIYGCFRRSAMQNVRVHVCAWWDRLYLTTIAALGAFVQVERVLWSRRHEAWKKEIDKRGLALATLRHQFQTIHPEGRVPFRCRLPSAWHLACVLGDLSVFPPHGHYDWQRMKAGPYAMARHYALMRDKIAMEVEFMWQSLWP